MNEQNMPAGELSDVYIKDVAEHLLSAGAYEWIFGVIEFSRAITEADRALRASPAAGDVETDDFLTIAYMHGHAKGKSEAQAALAAKDAAHERQLNACKDLIASLERQRTTLREGAEKWAEAVKSLLSEREANEILTNDLIAKDALLDAKFAEIEALKLRLLSASEGSQRAKEAEVFYRGAERMLTTGEKELHGQIAALTAERDAALAASRYETDLCGQALADLKEMTAERDALRKDAA